MFSILLTFFKCFTSKLPEATCGNWVHISDIYMNSVRPGGRDGLKKPTTERERILGPDQETTPAGHSKTDSLLLHSSELVSSYKSY